MIEMRMRMGPYLLAVSTLFALGMWTGAAYAVAPGTLISGPTFKMELTEPAPDDGIEYTVVPLPVATTVVEGFLVLKEQANLPNNQTTNWSDVLAFSVNPNGGSVVLMSDTNGDINPALLAQGYTTAQVLDSTNTIYMAEGQQGTTIYGPEGAEYNIYSDVDPPAPVPGLGPAGMAVLFLVLAGSGILFMWRRRRAEGREVA